MTFGAMTLAVDLYWSFRSPYSYLVAKRTVQFVKDYDIDLSLKTVYPLAIRNPDYYANLPPQRRGYFRLDPARVAEYLGVPFAPPDPDPVILDSVTRRPAPDQPYIRRLSYLGVEAALRGKGLPFVETVSHMIWSGEVKNWDKGLHLADAASKAGLDLADMDRTIAADPQKYEKSLADNLAALEASGHWGVPTFVFQGEPFFGQDRFDMLVWRLKQHGLRKR